MSRVLETVAAVVAALTLLPATAAAAEGPPLRVPEDVLAGALECSGDVEDAEIDPVILLPGTTLTPEQFSWNYIPALAADGVPYCTVTIPHHGMDDIQIAAEYVVHALRTVADTAGRDVDVVGHSQGGMVPRWALKYWPDTRELVDDLVGLAPSNHGTVVASAVCVPICAPSFWQQRLGSAFLTALNSGQETFAGIDYTSVYTRFDEVVVPNLDDRGSSSLRGGDGRITNVAIQDLCPARPTEHLTLGTSDPVGYALATDALRHDGPADPARVPGTVCTEAFMPAVDPVTLPGNEARLATTVATQVALYPRTASEPPLAPYARGDA